MGLGNDHYKWMASVTVGVARQGTLTAQWPLVLSIGHSFLIMYRLTVTYE